MAKCPNCDARISWDAASCAACAAAFDESSSWRPVAETPEEETNLTVRYRARELARSPEVRPAEAAWWGFKGLLSIVLLLVAAFFFLIYFRGLMDWKALGVGAFLLFLAAVPWVDFTRPTRAVGLVGIMFSIGIGLIAREAAVGNAVFPRDCSRRSLGCDAENLLFEIGGRGLVASTWALIALGLLAGSLHLVFRASRKQTR